MYKFISYGEYLNSNYVNSHPYARVNEEKTEVVLSCSGHNNDCACLTHAQALVHIERNWDKPGGE